MGGGVESVEATTGRRVCVYDRSRPWRESKASASRISVRSLVEPTTAHILPASAVGEPGVPAALRVADRLWPSKPTFDVGHLTLENRPVKIVTLA